VTAIYDETHATRFELRNGRGQRIVGLACASAGAENAGCVIISPGFGKQARHFGVFSRYLTRHRFRTLRFDFTNHVGNSDGDITTLTMSSMAEDTQKVLEYARREYPGEKIYLLSPSLSARAATRALVSMAKGAPPDRVLLVLPVVDVEATLHRVIGRNVVEEWRKRPSPGEPIKVLDHMTSLDFVGDALDSGFVGVEGASAELAAVAAPVTIIAGQDDEWVHTDEVRGALARGERTAKGARSLVVLESLTHDPVHNPPLMRLMMEQILAAFRTEEEPVRHLEFGEVVETVDAERKWARATAPSSEAV
jgi:alpha-beta hydrolase superfamily lysophospholipase